VLGFSHCDTFKSRLLRKNAIDALHASRIPVVVRSVREGYSLLCRRIRGEHRNQLARALVAGFLPELGPEIPRTDRNERRLRGLWHALAVGLRELVERSPRGAAALARSEAFRMGSFNSLLVRAERRRHPTP